jgi:hypothetical protein
MTNAEPRPVSSPVPTTQAAVNRPVHPLLAAACGLLLIAGGIIIFLLRRLRHGTGPSLISQSMRRSEMNPKEHSQT